jgi:DNA polymerase-3 subunit epsilon
MLALVFDTETTGKAAFKEPSVSPVQPNLVQLGMLLVDLSNGKEYAAVDLIVYPSSWEVPQEAALIHGVSTGLAKKAGVNLDTAVNAFLDLVEVADVVVAHNIVFDRLIMERAVAMVNLANDEDVIDPFNDKALFCTMRAATPIVKKKGRRPLHENDFKWPKLSECIQHFFNEELENAHSAIVDCRACARILVKLVEDGHVTLPTEPGFNQ